MSEQESLYINSPIATLDRITMILRCPDISLYKFDTDQSEFDFEFRRKKQMIDDLKSHFLTKLDIFDTEFQSRNFLYTHHLRTKQGLDIQFGPRFGIRQRIKDQEYVNVFGEAEDIEAGFMDEYFDSEFGIRLEWNPNKCDITHAKRVFEYIKVLCQCPYKDLIKITRMDFAIDYPESINPAFIHVSRSRKHFWASSNVRGIETVYHNSPKSRINFCIYDKKYEYEEKQNLKVLNDFLWRIEMRYQDPFMMSDFTGKFQEILETIGRLEILHNGKNLFKNRHEIDPTLTLVLNYAYHWGLSNALALFPDRTKARIRAQLRDLKEDKLRNPEQVTGEQFPLFWNEFESTIVSMVDNDFENLNKGITQRKPVEFFRDRRMSKMSNKAIEDVYERSKEVKRELNNV